MIEFGRLGDVPIDKIIALLNEPKNARHMPLASEVSHSEAIRPVFWGRGLEVTIAALDSGFDELGLDEVVIALPFSRNPTDAVARLGFVPDGEVTYGDATFRQYRLTHDTWAEVRPQLLPPEVD